MMDPSALLTNLKSKIETSQRNIENYQREVAEADAKIAALQIHIHNYQSKESAEQAVLEKLNKSRVRLEETVAALAEEWGLASDDSSPAPVVQSPAPVSVPVAAQPSVSNTVTSKKGKKEAVPVSTPAPAPAPAPIPVPAPVQEAKEDDNEGESSFEVTFKGVKYVVFEDNNEVIRADDESEEVIGNWDPVKKTIVFA